MLEQNNTELSKLKQSQSFLPLHSIQKQVVLAALGSKQETQLLRLSQISGGRSGG